jgi:hypothetical protein
MGLGETYHEKNKKLKISWHCPFNMDVLSSVEDWSVLENGTNMSVTTTYPILNATSLRQNPLYAKHVVFVLNLLTMGESSKTMKSDD